MADERPRLEQRGLRVALVAKGSSDVGQRPLRQLFHALLAFLLILAVRANAPRR